MILPLAEVDPSGPSIWVIAAILAALAALGLNVFQLFRYASGTDGQRQIEPTAIAAIQSELKSQTTTLGKLDREMGGVMRSVDTITRELQESRETHRRDVDGIHQRMGGISRELAGTSAKVDGLEKREGRS